MAKAQDGEGANVRLQPYLELVSALVEGGMEPEEFQRLYAERYLADETMWPDQEFLVLDKLFAETDDFEANRQLRTQMRHALNADDLRRSAAEALTKLRALAQGS